MRGARQGVSMRILSLVLAIFLGLTSPAFADGHVPGIFRVVDVADDDTLNIRRGPGSSYEIMGEFLPGEGGIEITALSANGKWGQTNYEGEAGWVFMRYLAAEAGSTDNLPFGLACSGTEPFWSLALKSDETAEGEFWPMGLVDEGTTRWGAVWAARPANRITPNYGFRVMAETSGHNIRASGIIRTQACNDGMSDREYGYSIDLLLRQGGTHYYVDGCCSLGE